MAEFRFYSTRREAQIALAEAFVGMELQFIPGRAHTSTTLERFTVLGVDFWRRLQNNHFFVVGEFTVSPLIARQAKNGTSDPKYYVNQQRGGPFLEVMLPGEKDESNKPCFNAGFVGYRTEFWDESLENKLLVSESLKFFFRSVVSKLKKQFIRRRLSNGVVIWIGCEAAVLLEQPGVHVKSGGTKTRLARQ